MGELTNVRRHAAERHGSLRRRDPRLQAWEQRFCRGVAGGRRVVVVNERALGQTSDEVARTTPTLRRNNLVIKVLGHGAPHLEDARG
jgi:hypothetical protein